MAKRIFRNIRIVEIVVCGGFAAIATSVLLAPHGSSAAAIVIYLFAAFAACMFELRIRGIRKAVERVSLELESVRNSDLEASTPVAERSDGRHEEELAASPLFARMMARRSIRLFTRGTWKGWNLELGTAIVVARDVNLYVSHVLVENDRLPSPFRIMTRGAVTRLSRASMQTLPTTTGNAEFDKAWVLDAEHGLATRVLDAELRERLLELSKTKDWGGVASVETTRSGLVLRWPEEVSAASAAYLRDLALKLCERLLADAAAN